MQSAEFDFGMVYLLVFMSDLIGERFDCKGAWEELGMPEELGKGMSRRVTSSYVIINIFLLLSSTHQAGPRPTTGSPKP